MSDTLIRMCKHGFLKTHRVITGQDDYWTCTKGGRKVVLDYEAAARVLVEWAYETEGVTKAAEAVIRIVDAALGRQSNE